jgi:isocitrate dehydrogenase
MFEAIHGSAPDIAGKGIANPAGLLRSGVMLLVHIGQPEAAEKLHNALLRTIEDGVHTGDIYAEGTSKERVGTEGFADAVIERLGAEPQTLKPVRYASAQPIHTGISNRRPKNKQLVGVDMFIEWGGDDPLNRDPNKLGELLTRLNGDGLQIIMVTNRGQKVWPDDISETFCTDHWRCRFQSVGEMPVTHHIIISLLQRAANAGFDVIKTENLYMFDGERGFSLGQGQ